MKSKIFWSRILGLALIVLALTVFLAPEIAEARRGGSFGGFRRGGGFGSFGSSRRSTAPAPKRSSGGSTFGGTRRSSTPSATPRVTSFGGTRMSAQSARAKYGAPRRIETMRAPGYNGGYMNYNVHHYGGFGSGLMTGYILGHTPWYWSMPFHPAFYYSRPNYVQNADGSVDVYPPTFSFAKLFFGLILLAAILFVLWRIYKSMKTRGRLTTRGGSFS